MAIADHIAAVIQKLQADSATLTLAGGAARISDQRPQDAVPNGYHIAVVAAGRWGAEGDLPIANRQVDLFCYGPTKESAMELYRTAYSALIPADRRGLSFTFAGCRVERVWELSGPQDLNDEGWPLVFTSLAVRAWETVQ